MSINPAMTESSDSVVQVVESIGEWFVRIVENGEVTALRSFEVEDFALSYADSQRFRLGLAALPRRHSQEGARACLSLVSSSAEVSKTDCDEEASRGERLQSR
jgi:hypothetical protein